MNYPRKSDCIVIGAGFAGLSAAITMASHGYKVTVLEKNSRAGGRANVLASDGFVFDMGPSWYWMPDVMERFFNRFGKSTADYFELKRLNPSYQVIFENNETLALPADGSQLTQTFEELEPGAGRKLERYLADAKQKYDLAMGDFVFKPSLSPFEFLNRKALASLFRFDLFSPVSSHVRKYFRNPKLIKILEFPVLFLGAMPSEVPALYSMMNHADLTLGTWYPLGGMWKLADAMQQLAREMGVELKFDEPVKRIRVNNGRVETVITEQNEMETGRVIAGADYHHVEQKLLEEPYRNYSSTYWNRKTMAPSSLIFYLGVSRKLPRLLHHNLFFDEEFQTHADAIYHNKRWPERPLFYVSCPSKTDPSVSPEGMENLFVLIPVAAGLEETEEVKEKLFLTVMNRLEKFCGVSVTGHLKFKRSYTVSDFKADYNSYRGNAYGLANTLRQTAFLKPSIRNKKVENLFFTGQLTVPGPGVPPAIISGQIVADYAHKHA